MAEVADVRPVTGLLNFAPGDAARDLPLLTIEDDSDPELAEVFEVELSILSVDGGPIVGARLDNSSSTAVLVVGASDDPHGVIQIAQASTSVAIAEDIPPQNTALGQAQLVVDRQFGTIGVVRALWELFPQSDVTVPNYVDLLFFGDAGANGGVVTPRPHTTTTALQFTGQSGSVVMVPSQYQPANIATGFTIRYTSSSSCVQYCTYSNPALVCGCNLLQVPMECC